MLVRQVPIPKRPQIELWLGSLVIVIVLVGVALPGFRNSGTRCGKPEEVWQLGKVGNNARDYFTEKGTFPIGRSQTLPSWSCCPGGCGAVPAEIWAADPIWAALGFSLDDATQVHYTYESFDGKTFRATAVRDVNCSGVRRTYVLEGSIENSSPVVRLRYPEHR